MSYYGIVYSEFWTGPTGRVIRQCGEATQVLALYLMSNAHANMLGLYRLYEDDIVHETGLSMEKVHDAFTALIHADFCAVDLDTDYVWVKQMVRFRLAMPKGATALGTGDKRITGVNRLYQALDPNAFLGEFFDLNQTRLWLVNRRDGHVSPLQAPSQGHTSPSLQITDHRSQVQITDRSSRATRSPLQGASVASGGGGKKARPVFQGTCFAVFAWQVRELEGMLGGYAEQFDLQSFFFDLDQRCSGDLQVLPHADLRWSWLQQQVLGEATRRGLQLAPVLTPVPTFSKQESRLVQMRADIAAREDAHDEPRRVQSSVRSALGSAYESQHQRGHGAGVLPHPAAVPARPGDPRRRPDRGDERVVSEDGGMARGGEDD